jgi:hypothetical protein
MTARIAKVIVMNSTAIDVPLRMLNPPHQGRIQVCGINLNDVLPAVFQGLIIDALAALHE